MVVNRVNSNGRFPNTVCGVVKQKGQFSWLNKKPMTLVKEKLAREILEGKHENNVKGALFFTNVKVWFKRKVLYVIGNHRFYG